MSYQSIEQGIDLAFHEKIELMQGIADPMIADPVFLEVISTNLLGPVATPDHRSPFAGYSLVLFGLLHFEEPRPQNPHSLFAVLDLRFLVLHRDNRCSGNVGEAHGRVRGVYRLPARTRRAKR